MDEHGFMLFNLKQEVDEEGEDSDLRERITHMEFDIEQQIQSMNQ